MKTKQELEVLEAELAALNAAVDDAIKTRTAWMDSHMSDYAEVQVGEDLYDLDTGYKVGVVSSLYRYHGTRDGGDKPSDSRFDRSMGVNYNYTWGDNIIRNTSSQISRFFGTKEKALKRAEQHLEDMRR